MSILVNKKDWIKIFRKDIKDKLSESKIEFDKYKKTGKIVYLQQAGNKLFSVVENWLMLKYKTKVNNYGDLKKLVKNDRNNRLLLSKVAQLHYFYYQNEVMGEAWEYEEIYLESYKIMKNRMGSK